MKTIVTERELDSDQQPDAVTPICSRCRRQTQNGLRTHNCIETGLCSFRSSRVCDSENDPGEAPQDTPSAAAPTRTTSRSSP